MSALTEIACRCGEVAFDLTGKPITIAACYCDSCRRAADRLEALEGAPPITEPDGSTRYVLQRKDRARCTRGEERLRAFRLTPASTTRRVVAACCNSPVYLDFQGGHWASFYAKRWPDGEGPPARVRTMTIDAPPRPLLADDVPSAKRQPLSFMGKLLVAWIAMGFLVPEVAKVEGEIHA